MGMGRTLSIASLVGPMGVA
ncbi:uncharacterized protein G2W53_016985 [Senna tora]|uniref:Uncharacterized protein n=1 Tax=Senna tora TaxID=362788 RepID=A0A834TRY4_9FABA|nr:uncharacterized protein G2W53_016985 [Senna tora]